MAQPSRIVAVLPQITIIFYYPLHSHLVAATSLHGLWSPQFPFLRPAGGRICYAEAGFCKACLGSPTCLGCIGQKVSYLRPLHLQLDVFPLTYGLFWALTASLLCFPHCLGASWGPHTLCVLWFPWKTLPCCLSVRCWGVMGYNQHLIVCEDLLFFWYKGVYIFYVLC